MIKNNPEKNRYELDIDGHIAIAEYRLEGNNIAITHVEVPNELRGRGIAAEVMKGVVEDAHIRGLTIIPVCSYAAAYMKRNS